LYEVEVALPAVCLQECSGVNHIVGKGREDFPSTLKNAGVVIGVIIHFFVELRVPHRMSFFVKNSFP
jgi:hypothetical protein